VTARAHGRRCGLPQPPQPGPQGTARCGL